MLLFEQTRFLSILVNGASNLQGVKTDKSLMYKTTAQNFRQITPKNLLWVEKTTHKASKLPFLALS